MTATPIEQEYVLEELKHLPVCEIDWPHLMEVNIRSRQTSKPAQYIVKECRKVLDSGLEHNLHIFVNSVEFIAKVIDMAKLTPEQPAQVGQGVSHRPAVRPRKEDKLLHLDLL